MISADEARRIARASVNPHLEAIEERIKNAAALGKSDCLYPECLGAVKDKVINHLRDNGYAATAGHAGVYISWTQF